MDALLTSVAAVGLAEIGDKTQLLALLLVARFLAPWSILWGILVATLINHGVSAWLGTALADMLDPQTLTITVGFAFLAIGIWLLKPDDDEALDADNVRYGVFMTAFVLFFVAEIGDKTQVATVLLGARFDDVLAVTLGTTLGMVPPMPRCCGSVTVSAAIFPSRRFMVSQACCSSPSGYGRCASKPAG